MSKLPNNAKIGKSQVTQWEVIKNCEYADNCLSKIVTLYVIRITQLSDFYTSDEPEINTVLARVSVTSENVFLNKATTIEVMEGIFPYKFELIESNSTALRYIDENGNYANLQFPYNPNGSTYDLAALSDKSGRVLALMPHPERGIFFTQQYNWPLEKEKSKRLGVAVPKYGDGMLIFKNALKYFC